MYSDKKRGFTLIELLVVIAIIGVLSTIVMASLGGARARGRDSRRISDIKQLQLALEIFYDANQAYPLALSELAGPGYIPNVPKDPRTNIDYQYSALQGSSGVANVCSSYHLGATLEIYSSGAGSPFNDDKDTTSDGTYGATQDGPICNGASADFNGNNDSTNKIYDMRP